MAEREQPQRANGEVRCAVDHDARLARVELERGEEIGFAIGAVRAAGFEIESASPRALAVRLGRRRLPSVVKALAAAGFVVRS